MEGETLLVVGFMVMVAERLVEALKPVIMPGLAWLEQWARVPPAWALMVCSWLIASVVVWLTGANLFVGYVPNPLAGQVLTAVVAGGGSNLLNDIWSNFRQQRSVSRAANG